MWDSKRKALLDIWLRWIAALINSDGAYDDKLRMPRSEGPFLLSGRYYAPQGGLNDFETFTTDRCPGFLMVATAEEKKFLFACPGFQIYVFYTAPEKRTLAKKLQMKRITLFWHSPNLSGIASCSMQRLAEKDVSVCVIMLTLFSFMYPFMMLFFLPVGRLFPFSPVQPGPSMNNRIILLHRVTSLCKIIDIV